MCSGVLNCEGMADRSAVLATHSGALFRYLCRAVGEAEAARDLTQEVFLRATRTPMPANGNGHVTAWLFRIARNLALDYHRGQRRHPPVEVLRDQVARSASQDVELAVNQALASLTDLDRDVFLMREVAGLGYEQIAAACELTPDAVRSRICRARLALREQLAAPIATSRGPAAQRSLNTKTRTDQ